MNGGGGGDGEEVDLYTYITSDPGKALKFEEYLVSQGFGHQYDFVCLAQELKTSFDPQLQAQPLNLGRAIREICKTYLNLVSVSEKVKLSIENRITFQEYSTDIFDVAVKEVWTFLSTLVYKQFLHQNFTKCNTILSDSKELSFEGVGDHRRREGQNKNVGSTSITTKENSVGQFWPVESISDRLDTHKRNNNNNLTKGEDVLVSDMDSLSLSNSRQTQWTEGPIVVTRKYLINRDRDSLPEKKPPPRQSPIEHQKLPMDFARKLEEMQGKREFVKGLNIKLKEKLGDKSNLDEPDDILDEHVKIVWAGDVTPEKSTSPPTRREYRRRDTCTNPCLCQGTKNHHHHHTREYQDGLTRSRTFPVPSQSPSKCDPDSGISVVSMSTNTSASVKSYSEDKMGPRCFNNNNNNNGSKFSIPPNPLSDKWRRGKGIPVVVHCHGNPVPFYFVIPKSSATVNLRMFKDYLPMKDNYRYLFQYSGRKGVGMEEIFEDASEIPIYNGQIVARIRPFF